MDLYALNKSNNNNIESSKYLLQTIDKPSQRLLSRSQSLSRSKCFEYILSDSGSEVSNSGDEEEFLQIYSSERRRLSSSQISDKLDSIAKEEVSEMLEAVESTFNHLQKRTTSMFETVERINRKHHKTSNDMKNFIDVIKEMKEEARALIRRQEKIGNNYKHIDQVVAGSRPTMTRSLFTPSSSSSYKPALSTYSTSSYQSSTPTTLARDRYCDTDDDEEVIPSPIRCAKKYSFTEQDEEPIQHTKPKQYNITDDEEEPDIVKRTSINLSDEDDVVGERLPTSVQEEPDQGALNEEYDEPAYEETPKKVVVDDRTQSEIESDEEWERQEEERKKKLIAQQEAARAAEDSEDEREEERLKMVAAEMAHDDYTDYDEELARRDAEQEMAKFNEDDDDN